MRNLKTLIAFVAVLLTVGALWFANRAVPPGKASWEDVLAEGKAGGYKIITTDELCNRYQKDAKNLLLGTDLLIVHDAFEAACLRRVKDG